MPTSTATRVAERGMEQGASQVPRAPRHQPHQYATAPKATCERNPQPHYLVHTCRSGQLRVALGGGHDSAAAHLQDAPQDVLQVRSRGSGTPRLPITDRFKVTDTGAGLHPTQQLRQVHNYHSLMAIISGLNLSAVSRLKTVKEDKANKVHILKLTARHHIC